MDEKESDELMADLTRYADAHVYAGFFKGLPEDKHLEEIEVARIVLQQLGKEAVSIDSEPEGPDTSPDLAVLLDSGERIGIEITELVSRQARHLHSKRRKAERQQGLSSKDALDGIIQTGLDPVACHISPFAHANWDDATVAAKIDECVRKKDNNKHLQKNASNYDVVWLAIFTDEVMISRDMVLSAKAKLNFHLRTIKNVFTVLSYDPADGCCPVVEIT
jgi:hypothetical protein